MMKVKEIDLSSLGQKWSSAYVTRNKVEEFTGGMITAGSIANFDSKGNGPEERFIINRKTAYPVGSLIQWLEKRARAKH